MKIKKMRILGFLMVMSMVVVLNTMGVPPIHPPQPLGRKLTKAEIKRFVERDNLTVQK